MLTREEIKARLLEHRPNICNDLRADESEEFKNFTDEECLDLLIQPLLMERDRIVNEYRERLDRRFK